MSSARLLRLSGLALMLALPFQIIGFALHPPSEAVSDVLKATYGSAHLVLLVSWCLILLGLPGLYAHQAERAGKLGLSGFVLTMIATAYHFYLLLYEAFATPLLAQEPATRGLVGEGGTLAHGVATVAMIFTPFILAWPLFGVATLRARVLPRGSAWLQIASLPVFIGGTILMSSLVPADQVRAIPSVVSPLGLGYFLLALGYAWGGYALWTEQARPAPATSPTSMPQPAA